MHQTVPINGIFSRTFSHTSGHTWSIDDGQVGAVLVLNAHDNLPGPELLLSFQTVVLSLNVVLPVT